MLWRRLHPPPLAPPRLPPAAQEALLKTEWHPLPGRSRAAVPRYGRMSPLAQRPPCSPRRHRRRCRHRHDHPSPPPSPAGHPFFDTAQLVFDLAKASNDKGDHFPLMGICLGMETLAVIVSGGGACVCQGGGVGGGGKGFGGACRLLKGGRASVGRQQGLWWRLQAGLQCTAPPPDHAPPAAGAGGRRHPRHPVRL